MSLEGRKIVMLLGPNYQDQEAEVPLDFLRSRGATVDVVGLQKGPLAGLKNEALIEVDKTIEEIKVEDYDAMVIPGGRSPASLRKVPVFVEFVKTFYRSGRTVAAVCHGPQMLAAAGLLKGKTITGYHKIKGEMISAGAHFIDEPVVIEGNLITSREPKDLPVFNRAIEEALS